MKAHNLQETPHLLLYKSLILVFENTFIELLSKYERPLMTSKIATKFVSHTPAIHIPYIDKNNLKGTIFWFNTTWMSVLCNGAHN